MVRKAIPIGIEFYKEMIDKDYYYVDKTWMIKELLDKKGKVNLFTRPRRFGKTLMLTMLKTFFEKEITIDGNAVDNNCYFVGKKIMQAGEAYTSHMGQYPVIFMNLKTINTTTYEKAYRTLMGMIIREFERHSYVLKSEKLSDVLKNQYREILMQEATMAEYVNSLSFLSMCLYLYHNKKVIIMLDDYDVPLQNAYLYGFYDDMLVFIRTLYESVLQTNEYLEFAVLTGCLRTSKEIKLDNLNIISILGNGYSEYPGFGQKEVEELLSYYGIYDSSGEVKQRCGGYSFGENEIYNPWSVINYVNHVVNRNTSHSQQSILDVAQDNFTRKLLDSIDLSVQEKIEKLKEGGTVIVQLYEDITCDTVYKSSEHLWNYLFCMGYLKKESLNFDGLHIYMTLAMTNDGKSEELTY